MWWAEAALTAIVFFTAGFVFGTLYDGWLERNEGDYPYED